MPDSPRILVIRRRYLGDVVLLGSLFGSLRAHWPQAHIEALVEPAYAPILALNPDVNGVTTLPRGLGAWPGFIRLLRAKGFTHVLDIDNTEKTALAARLCGAAVRVGLHHGKHPFRLRALYTDVVHGPQPEHDAEPITEYYLKALGPLGVPVASRRVRLVPREAEVARWRSRLVSQSRSLLVHPGSRSPWRMWPSDRFAAVCDRVQDELGVQVILVGGPAEHREIAAIRRLAKTHLLVQDPAPSLTEFAALAAACSAFLCHDSGPMHIAAAVGTPVVALYGSQNPVLFRPHGEGHTLLVPPMPCTCCTTPAACVAADSYHNHCVRYHAVDQVFAAVKACLARPRPETAP